MTAKVYTLDTVAGVQRDGTVFDKGFYADGKWVRFQRKRPRKIGGYRVISDKLTGPSRGIWVNPKNSQTSIFSGYSDGLQVFSIDNNGVGSGFQNFTLNNFTPSDLNLWQIDGFYDVSGSGLASLIAHPGQNLEAIDNETNTPVLIGDINGTTLSKIGVFTVSCWSINGTKNLTLTTTSLLIGAGQTVTGTGIPANTTVVSAGDAFEVLGAVTVTSTSGAFSCTSTPGLFVNQTITVGGSASTIGLVSGRTYYIISTNGTTTFTLSETLGGPAVTTIIASTSGITFTTGSYYKVVISNNATATAQNTLTFDNGVSVSGGVVVLHPYVFVYGNNGLIRNCSAGNASNWVSADANEVNVASGKIVKGLPVRGGSNSPSGLFWATDSLIRVSYAPQSLGIAGTSNFSTPNYWRYDVITSQSSILSSQCVIEYDGIYYWIGVDRFLLYNGTVKEIPNDFNQNYFFDNLNYSQREKVWATKVPRFGEIWWFYPRGDSPECNDAIIYNVRENVWYDAGGAVGARRSAGYFSQVFAYPIAADWVTTVEEEVFQDTFTTVNGSVYLNTATYYGDAIVGQVISGDNIPAGTTVTAVRTSGIRTLGTITGGSGYTNNTYNNVPFTTGSGFSGTANIVVSGGAVTSVTIVNPGSAYQVGDVLSVNNATLGGGAGFSVPITAVWTMTIVMSAAATGTDAVTLTFSTPPNLIEILQHEYGKDYVKGQNALAIESYFETNDLGWVSGGPSQPLPAGENRWLRLERVEPDFLLNGEMSLIVTGRPYAQSDDKDSQPYVFDSTTGKIDMKEQRRELRLRFVSNTVGGDYQLGKILVNADLGDVRGYS